MTNGEEEGAARAAPGTDRRDSARLPLRIMVREVELGGSFEERPGDLSLSGVYYTQGHPPQGSRVELRFLLPGRRVEVRAGGEILSVTRGADRYGAHVRFVDLPLEDELAIARYLQEEGP